VEREELLALVDFAGERTVDKVQAQAVLKQLAALWPDLLANSPWRSSLRTSHEILARLARLSELAPEMRFGQLIANLAFMAAGPWDQTLWDLEDAPLLGAIRQLEADLSRRASDADLTTR
jgi:hypothetical protein